MRSRQAPSRGAFKLIPDPKFEAWSSTAVDLTLDKELVILRKTEVAGVRTSVNPSSPDYQFDKLIQGFGEKVTIGKEGYDFKSGDFLLSWTREQTCLPHRSRLAARVEGKSSLARLGIGVHLTAPTIHAGFGYKTGDDNYPGNPLQLKMWNCGPLDIKLMEGMPICQLIFEIVDGTPEKGYEGCFSVQGPSVPGGN